MNHETLMQHNFRSANDCHSITHFMGLESSSRNEPIRFVEQTFAGGTSASVVYFWYNDEGGQPSYFTVAIWKFKKTL